MNSDSPTRPRGIDEVEWNFSVERISDKEVLACCYWEYARESQFIRAVRERCIAHVRAESSNWNPVLYNDIERIQGLGYAAEVFLGGFFFLPDRVVQSDDQNSPDYRHPEAPAISGSFPNPWQSLPLDERKSRSSFRSDIEVRGLVPFRRGHSLFAKDIVEYVTERRRVIEGENEEASRMHPELSEEELIRKGLKKNLSIQPSIYPSGREWTVTEICWSDFTDDEIAVYLRQWVKKNRPKQFPAPNNQGQKVSDWRVALRRLGIMRCLNHFSFADPRFPKEFREQGEKDCYKARKEAGVKFRQLFPCFLQDKVPIHWETAADQKRRAIKNKNEQMMLQST